MAPVNAPFSCPKSAIAAIGPIVDGAGDDFFAGAGLAGEQDGGAGRRGHRRRVDHAPHGLALAEQLATGAEGHDFVAEGGVLTAQTGDVEAGGDREFELGRRGVRGLDDLVPHAIDRLAQESEDAGFIVHTEDQGHTNSTARGVTTR